MQPPRLCACVFGPYDASCLESNSSDVLSKNCFLYKMLRMGLFGVLMLLPHLSAAFISNCCTSGWLVMCQTPPPWPPPPPPHNQTELPTFLTHSHNPFVSLVGVFLQVWQHANEGFLSAVVCSLPACLGTDNRGKNSIIICVFLFSTSINNFRC